MSVAAQYADEYVKILARVPKIFGRTKVGAAVTAPASMPQEILGELSDEAEG